MIRRPLTEFLAAIALEKSVGFLFVEGPSDRVIIAQFVSWLLKNDWSVFDCTQVELENDNQENGNRARIIRVANEAVRRGAHNVICIIDQDFDIFLGLPNADEVLRYTDFANLAMYGFDYDDFRNVLSRYVKFEVPQAVIDDCVLITKAMFLLRFLKWKKQIRPALPSVAPCIVRRGGRAVVDLDCYLKSVRTLPIGRAELVKATEEAVSESEHRKIMNDHEFAKVMARVLHLFKNANVVSSEIVLGALRMQIAPPLCVGYPLFQYIAGLAERLLPFRTG
jgi:hypothetical protein